VIRQEKFNLRFHKFTLGNLNRLTLTYTKPQVFVHSVDTTVLEK